MGETEDERTAQASQLFENFVQACTCKGTLQAFSILCRQLELDPLDCSNFYSSLKAAVSSWKVKALWAKLDKRAQQKVYNQNKACQSTRCLIIGGGPCGLRTAIELALLGCKVVVIEKRDAFSRNNVLHLWPYTIHDLRGLGAKKFYGKFCAGSLDHISIRQLQLMLLKVSLILGVEIHVNVEFVKLLEPPEEQSQDGPGWRAEVRPASHPVSNFDFDVVIGADGRKDTLDGFRRKEFRGKLAIAITANFVNRNTTAEAKVEEISGVAFIFNQKFFLDLKEETGIDLENIVYYKDNTHYFVMTAKKQSLLDKGVILKDFIETERLLGADNVSQEALRSYAREAADFATNYELPSLDFALNHYRQPDVAMFDFTCMYASENAALIREKHGHQLLVALVGDSLLEPFWPMGTGCARGFLAAFDAAWMVRAWAQGRSPLEILAERESLYRLLPQTTTENISKNFEQYSIDPSTRYPNLNSSRVRPQQVRHLYISDHHNNDRLENGAPAQRSVNLFRKESEVRPGRLLAWCQDQTRGYRGVDVRDLTSSWRSGLALCALIHQQRPDLIDYDSLKEEDVAVNNQLAFDMAEREFGIQPVTTGSEMAQPDKLLMVLYLSKFYEAFRSSPGNGSKERGEHVKENSDDTNHNLPELHPLRKRTPREDKPQEEDSVHKRRRKGNNDLTELSCHSAPPACEEVELQENRVRSLATQLQAKFEENLTGSARTKCVGRRNAPPGLGGSDICHFCTKRVYVMERLSAEGFFFHRECFRCDVCRCMLRLGGHTFDSQGAKFYCRMHSAQRQASIQPGMFTRRPEDRGHAKPSPLDGGIGSPAGSAQMRPPGEVELHRGDPDDTEMAVEALEASCIITPSEEERSRGESSSKNHVKRKIRISFPLIFKRSGPETVPEVDEEKCSSGKPVTSQSSSADSQKERSEDSSAAVKSEGGPSKKRLVLSSVQREEFLKWEDAITPNTPQEEEQVQADVDKLQTKGLQSQSRASSQSAFQALANAFRRTFSRSSGAAVIMKPKRDGVRKQRPVSDGAFTFSSLLCIPESAVDGKRLSGHGAQWVSVGADPWGAGQDLPSLLQKVAIRDSRDSEGAFEDSRSHPHKRVDLFSSLRMRRKRDSEETDQQAQNDIQTILSNFRNKASSQKNLDELSSSEDENENVTSNPMLHAEKSQKKRERVAALQAKREQLKRLHRAQVIQRQLEEVGEKQREIEERGVQMEKIIRGETDSPEPEDGDEAQLYQSWFKLVLEKNRLARYESELMIFAQELQLEDSQSRLQQELRHRMAVEDTKKSASELQEEQEILAQIMSTVEKRDTLVSILEEQRLKERAEDKDLETLVLSKGFEFHWGQGNDSWGR
ncbi:protein-methionine sulfoxide oxidase mical2b isoform X4 [Oryzias latipes]|uniref:protein-methionine sulfoxide oxidase mical2b isoform X4 n=1 Tax=Oryzias latipes TaxID=8090 RepID=UPI000CE19869|nr:protein-methionine sulfoxide oxidase mical2b isoform X4 [Oryzias latipes]